LAEPTIAEVQRLLRRMSSDGVVKRLDVLHEALCEVYRTGRRDERERVERESCLEG
jgi:hypothetical protein